MSQPTKIGPLGSFPEGKHSDDDKGALAIGISSDHDKQLVVVAFGTPCTWLGMPKQDAIAFAELILEHAKELT